METERDEFLIAFDLISKWIGGLLEYPGFKEWKNASIVSTMTYGDLPQIERDVFPNEFLFPDHIIKQHTAISSLLSLHSTWQSLRDTEYYFRRFPFHNLPIDLETHLRYTCENYFSRVYEFSERLKKCLNSINMVIIHKIDAGSIIKKFSKDFRYELKERNLIHHHDSFDDLMIKKIRYEGLMAFAHKGKDYQGWKHEQRQSYRKAAREWADRAKKRSSHARQYLNLVADIFSTQCLFLREPIV